MLAAIEQKRMPITEHVVIQFNVFFGMRVIQILLHPLKRSTFHFKDARSIQHIATVARVQKPAEKTDRFNIIVIP